ncbi:hypothetical protein H8B06_10305 [Sphingobacterium sp. DN00404]|uniref:SusD-like N-terminal domain-containing protein n=1 Tax=Sphingobacterium micropteri TaxID=2763501 RepID=A0ABR7YPL6_9SPHI|nr:hypothetical protein [Sphingobacterium micropteri]MBD1433219.1 hypothetical protein [Sphingobacterium micropteri]
MNITLFYKLFILGLIAISFNSCRLDLNDSSTYPAIDQQKIILHHYSVYGLLPVSQAYTDAVLRESERGCFKPDRSFINGVLAAVTLGIYTPNGTGN